MKSLMCLTSVGTLLIFLYNTSTINCRANFAHISFSASYSSDDSFLTLDPSIKANLFFKFELFADPVKNNVNANTCVFMFDERGCFQRIVIST
jgi:hypothetical protein